MADKRTQRQQQRLQKQKKVRAQRQRARKDRMEGAAVEDVGKAGHWSLGEAYLSSNWHEQGAQVTACFTRVHPSGRTAAARFEVDLASRGVISVTPYMLPSPDHVHGLLAEDSEGHPMLETDPTLVVHLLHEAERHARSQGHGGHKGVSALLGLFGDVDPALAPHDILVGAAPPPAEKKVGWLGRLFGG